MGATRVITDRGWVGHERQIGTTGVVVDPRLYIAFGISGAVQHTSGLGTPDHIISVNTDPHCPMMQLADLAVVADANAVLDELRAADSAAEPVAEPDFDVVVVGAGPAGSCAATVLARAGRRVLLLERGPVRRQQEHVRRRRVPAHPRRAHPAVVGRGTGPAVGHPPLDDGADRHAGADRRLPQRRRGAGPPYNGATAYRPDFDHWLAGQAEAAGAELLSRHDRHRSAARAGRAGRSACAPTAPTATSRRRVVIACDGVNSFLAKEAGLLRHGRRRQLHARRQGDARRCPKDVIDERFGVRGRDGVDIEIIGGTGGVNGGGFVYTNLDTVAVGVVLEAAASWPPSSAGPRRSSPTSRRTRRSLRSSRAAS